MTKDKIQNTQQKQSAELANNKDKKYCEIGFWMSFIGLLLSLIGFAPGGVLIICEFIFAKKGLHTTKRKKAIATIVIKSVYYSVLKIIIGTQRQNG